MVDTNDFDTFNRFTKVSRETISSLKKYEKLLIKGNENLNLVGKSTINKVWTRHFLDSYQVIDFIEENTYDIFDIGSGAGFPGLVLALAAKEKGFKIMTHLIEKSPKKTKFLKETINELNLNAEVINENVFEYQSKIRGAVFIVRAFKPLEVVLELIHKICDNWGKIIIFMGKTGESELLQASKIWNIEYKKRASVTNNDSIILEINSYKKK
jgi:16S rRNA (guanine527-N7)-methyltransferase